MRIAVIGAGPAGLLFATLIARELPASTVDVYERNGADEAFGFGVVFGSVFIDNFFSLALASALVLAKACSEKLLPKAICISYPTVRQKSHRFYRVYLRFANI